MITIKYFLQKCLIFIGLLFVLNLTGLLSGSEEPQEGGEKTTPQKQEDLLDMSFEDLLNIEVTTVSKKEQKLSEVPAAISVITQEDIRRSGATNIPEALRLVPGVQVARINANSWAISIRGFNGEFANKLLVMIDGRSIYTPLHAGVYWDEHDVMLEDVERIEVIRGPGGTLWGANAVNGIINIITKKAKDTQGALMTGGGGTEEQGFGAVRFGGKINDKAYFRIYSKYFNRDDAPFLDGGDGADTWDAIQGGFRLDWDPSENDTLSLQGNIASGQVGYAGYMLYPVSPYMFSVTEKQDIKVGNTLGRWQHSFSDGSDMTLQLYYDRTDRWVAVFDEIRDTFDIDFQHSFSCIDRHEIIWGLGHRLTKDHTKGTLAMSMDPPNYDLYNYSGFVQDQITLWENYLKLTLGSKFEYNDFSGFEYQPSGRIIWTPNPDHSLWTSVTRAVRTPVRFDHDDESTRMIIPGYPPSYTPIAVASLGNDDVKSEKLLSYELGYRVRPRNNFFLDFALFFNDYDDLRTFESGTPMSKTTPFAHMLMPLIIDNKMDGESYGAELSASWEIMKNWTLNAGYSFLQMQLHQDNDSTDTSSATSNEGRPPHNQAYLRSNLDLPGNLELDLALNYVDTLPDADIPSYFRFDARLGWHLTDNVELSLVGQNLLDNRHPEFYYRGYQLTTEVQRGFYAKLTCKF